MVINQSFHLIFLLPFSACLSFICPFVRFLFFTLLFLSIRHFPAFQLLHFITCHRVLRFISPPFFSSPLKMQIHAIFLFLASPSPSQAIFSPLSFSHFVSFLSLAVSHRHFPTCHPDLFLLSLLRRLGARVSLSATCFPACELLLSRSDFLLALPVNDGARFDRANERENLGKLLLNLKPHVRHGKCTEINCSVCCLRIRGSERPEVFVHIWL